MYRRGWSLRIISNEFNVRKSTIYYHVRKRLGRKLAILTMDNEPTAELGELLGRESLRKFKLRIGLTDPAKNQQLNLALRR